MRRSFKLGHSTPATTLSAKGTLSSCCGSFVNASDVIKGKVIDKRIIMRTQLPAGCLLKLPLISPNIRRCTKLSLSTHCKNFPTRLPSNQVQRRWRDSRLFDTFGKICSSNEGENEVCERRYLAFSGFCKRF